MILDYFFSIFGHPSQIHLVHKMWMLENELQAGSSIKLNSVYWGKSIESLWEMPHTKTNLLIYYIYKKAAKWVVRQRTLAKLRSQHKYTNTQEQTSLIGVL